MNIQEAKQEISRTLRAYRRRNAGGKLLIPREKQRPILMIGPPGIGKTAIVAQIAAEEGIGLVSYTMTHHTRQSAIGLPILEEHEYAGQKYTATHYTMSEMIAAIHESGYDEGILFLDEINCVSETLAPVMLQLLQNKTFGTHTVPEGWIIVAAGNPPEYNRSVRELDMATLDRVKHMEIEADEVCWMHYARKMNVHPAIRSFLTAYPNFFYVIENKPEGQFFVTARGWEDLSCILYAYEDEGADIREDLILQYLQHDRIAREFWLYYDLYAHGQETESLSSLSPSRCLIAASAEAASVKRMIWTWKENQLLKKRIQELNPATEERIRSVRRALQLKLDNNIISEDEIRLEDTVLRILEERKPLPADNAEEIQTRIEAAYRFLETASRSDAAIYFTQELFADQACGEFLNLHKVPACQKYASSMLLTAQEKELLKRLT